MTKSGGSSSGGVRVRNQLRRWQLPVRRWDPWNAPLAIGLAGGLYALEWLVGVSLEDGLVDASLTGLVNFLFLTWWRG